MRIPDIAVDLPLSAGIAAKDVTTLEIGDGGRTFMKCEIVANNGFTVRRGEILNRDLLQEILELSPQLDPAEGR